MARPLSGLRVLDLSIALSGPYCSLILGDLGAEVLKIEPPGGELFRTMGPHYRGEWSVYFVGIHRNKRGIVLNLKTEAGRRAFHDLVRISDVVLDNFRAGVLEKLRSACPSGIWPRDSLRPLASWRPWRSGLGQRVDASMFDSQISLLSYVVAWYTATGEVPRPLGTGHLGIEPYGAYRSTDGHLVLTTAGEKFWQRLCEVLGVPELAFDPRYGTVQWRHANRKQLTWVLEEILATRTAAEWMRLMEEAGIPAAPMNSVDRAL